MSLRSLSRYTNRYDHQPLKQFAFSTLSFFTIPPILSNSELINIHLQSYPCCTTFSSNSHLPQSQDLSSSFVSKLLLPGPPFSPSSAFHSHLSYLVSTYLLSPFSTSLWKNFYGSSPTKSFAFFLLLVALHLVTPI